MKLSIVDRLMIPTLMPKQGSIVLQVLAKSIIEKTSLTADEVYEWGIKSDEGKISWNQNVQEVDFTFNPSEIQFLKDCVAQVDKDGQVTPQNLATCLKIQSYAD